MSGDETLVLILSLACCGWYFLGNGYRSLTVRVPGYGPAVRLIVVVAWVVSLVLLFWVLRSYASFDVRDSGYLIFYMVVGAAWTGLACTLLKWMDWHYLEDVLERNNPAAALAQAGAILGIMLAFAGANIGDGPSWAVVIFCAMLSTGALFVLWMILDFSTGWIGNITIDRDVASGVRAGSFFISGGLIAGRVVAGDWVSVDATLVDFWAGIWGLLPLGVVAGFNQFLLRPNERNPHGSIFAAVLGGFVFLGYGVVYLYYQGPLT